MSKKDGFFKVKSVTKFKDLVDGSVKEIPESDLCFQNTEAVIQLEYVDPKKGFEKRIVEPGIFILNEGPGGIYFDPLELRKRDRLLESINNTSKILLEARNFFNKLHIYEALERPKKRAVLLYSSPGMGKSSAIEKFCSECMTEDPGTVVVVWPTSAVDADSVFSMLSTKTEYAAQCTRLILIMEDIGGSEGEGRHRRDDIDSGLLNLLDGVGVAFKLPTFIIATTNFPENLLQSLADRPGRFDLMMELKSPSYEEKISLVEFIAKRSLSSEEKEALKRKEVAEFSIAHLEEMVIRSLLHDKQFIDVIGEMIAHTEKFKNSFEERKSLGLGLGR
jgi:hypothetical protein